MDGIILQTGSPHDSKREVEIPPDNHTSLPYTSCAYSLIRVRVFVTPWTSAGQAPLSVEFSSQEYLSGFPWLPPGGLPNLGIEPRPSALQADSLPSEPPGKPSIYQNYPLFTKGS